MAPSVTVSKHFILAMPMAYGHIRLESNLVCDAVRLDHSLMVTIFVTKYMAPVVTGEVSGKRLSTDALSRVRVIGVGDAERPGMDSGATPQDVLLVPIQDAYNDLFRRQTVTCAETNATYDYHGIPHPTAIFVDCIAFGVIEVVNAMRMGMKIIHIYPSTANAMMVLYGPPRYGGKLDLEDRAKALLAQGDGRDFLEIAQSILSNKTGALLQNAEGLEMYDYEERPQAGMEMLNPAGMIMACAKYVVSL